MKPSKCPTCSVAAPSARYAPFCSKRCADIALQRSFAGAYAIPGEAGSFDLEGPGED